MEKSEYHQLLERRKHLDDAVPTIRADGFPEGTLLYGYTIERSTFHVYVRDGEIHALTYDNLSYRRDDERNFSLVHHIHGKALPAASLVPSKRAYPERTRTDFARAIEAAGLHIPFTTFSDNVSAVREGEFCGFTAEESMAS